MLTVFLSLSDLLIPNQPEHIYVLDKQVFISPSVKKESAQVPGLGMVTFLYP